MARDWRLAKLKVAPNVTSVVNATYTPERVTMTEQYTPLTHDEIVVLAKEATEKAFKHAWDDYSSLTKRVIYDEFERGDLDSTQTQDAAQLTMDFISNGFAHLGIAVGEILCGEIDETPKEFTFETAEKFLGTLNHTLQHILELFFPFAESEFEQVEEVADLVNEMKANAFLLHDKVSRHLED